MKCCFPRTSAHLRTRFWETTSSKKNVEKKRRQSCAPARLVCERPRPGLRDGGAEGPQHLRQADALRVRVQRAGAAAPVLAAAAASGGLSRLRLRLRRGSRRLRRSHLCCCCCCCCYCCTLAVAAAFAPGLNSKLQTTTALPRRPCFGGSDDDSSSSSTSPLPSTFHTLRSDSSY